jgi:hypothetical protein
VSTPICLIPVRCPYCGSTFVIDPALETASITEGTDAEHTGDPPVAFRPTCPRCRLRATVWVAPPPAEY